MSQRLDCRCFRVVAGWGPQVAVACIPVADIQLTMNKGCSAEKFLLTPQVTVLVGFTKNSARH